ncbi:MAG: alpha-galactosidase [Clostridiales bacterium]|nr:alpha-galactosidase [Clostridiales bacterium]
MSILYEQDKFIIETQNTAYVFKLFDHRFPVHLYYGNRKQAYTDEIPKHYRSFSPYYEKYGMVFSPDCALSECPFFGHGDFRTAAIKIRNQDGNSVTSFAYEKHEIIQGRRTPKGLPFAEPDENTQTLIVYMKDNVTECALSLYYTVFADKDVITRSFTLHNKGTQIVKIEKAMSLTLDIEQGDFDFITLYGGHAAERHYQREHVGFGMQGVCSRRGASSHQFNPFMAVCEHTADEDHGLVYGFNFVYSGSFLNEIEKDPNGRIRIQTGLGEENFGFLLHPSQSFDAPEAVMTCSHEGLGGLSVRFHRFIRAHILPKDPYIPRPVVLNTWEASYFDIDQDEMLRYAKAAADCGIDMLVMDDGWFGKRDDDTTSLGDWFVHKKKFPDGLAPLIQKIKETGLKFGIWIEPEMVNPHSELYQKHPEWCLQAPGRELLLSRHQLVLDFANPEVIDYLEELFEKTLGPLDIDYIKWDMNRHMCSVASPCLPAEQQDETSFRYMLGVYRLFRWFHKRFPQVMIENCSGGGGRYDLGMMKYSTQIWTSDMTGPKQRIFIQHGSALAYPPCVMSCHVSDFNGLTNDSRTLDFAFRVATGGVLGYEMKLPDMSTEVKDTIAAQIQEYRRYEPLIVSGDFYCVHNPIDSPYYSYYFISPDKDEILAVCLQAEARPAETLTMFFGVPGEALYKEEKTGKEYTGRALNTGFSFDTKPEAHSYCLFHFKRIR